MMRRRKTARIVAARGHALLMTLILLAILGAAVTSMFVSQASAVRVTGDMIATRQAFYACDGISRSMVKLAQGYLKDVAEADADDLAAYVCAGAGMGGCDGAAAKLPDITPPGFTVTDFKVGLSGESFTSPLPSGPFRGMNARQTPVTLFVRAEKDSSGHACESSQQIVLAQIGLFQFFVFAEEFADLYNGPPMTIDGRVHVNGDFCGHRYTTSDLRIRHMTASGRIFAGSNSCPRSRPTSDNHLYFWDGGSWQQMNRNNHHDCSGGDCPGGWADYALSRWNGHVLDKAHGVPELKVPVSGTPPVQDGLNSDGDVQNNSSTQRFLIDPPMFGHEPVDPAHPGDTDEVLSQKFACKADIRIINGVWYLRDPDDATCSNWPGTPIWSDHPGRFPVGNNEEEGVSGTQSGVGQHDLAEDYGWAYNWRPQRYSFYESDNTGLLLNNGDTVGVVSYGSVFRDTGPNPDVFVPGMWAAKSTGNSGRFCGNANGTSSIALRRADNYACDCSGSSCAVHVPANYLQGTRSGFSDPRVGASDSSRMRILPMNFDVAAFADALTDTSSYELGSYFVGRDFNGIVWITNTWNGQLNGFGNDGENGAGKKLAVLWPNPVQNPAPGQPRSVTEDRLTGRLPYPLCSKNVAGSDFTNQAGSSNEFTVPHCGDTSHPSALRIINGYTIDPNVFPKGLTIATNLPAYILGDFNKHSDDEPDDWRPVLVAADALTLLSNAFDDTESTWQSISSLTSTSRDADPTHYRFALITGDVSTSPGGGNQSTKWGGGINNFPRFIEDWKDSVPCELYGSMVIGFRSVFHRQKYRLAGGTSGGVYNAPRRDWFYDINFDVISNQPPGAPVYEVQAMKKWARN